MATDLQRQIAQLKAQQVNAEGVHKGRPSIFLTPQEAAAVDVEEVYDAGVGGLQALQELDGRFGAYFETLFHPSSVRLQRELKSSEENKILDQQISSLLRLLSIYSAEKSAHLILEYLIRRFRIHELNTEELVKSVISLHDTKVP
jgi:U3 small nucleolar RNA-associated protein 10